MDKNYLPQFSRHSLILAGFAFCIGTSLWLIDLLTKSRIKSNEYEIFQTTLAQALANQPYDNDLVSTKRSVYDNEHQQTRAVYTAKLNNKSVANIISARAPDGYAGNIDLLIGVLQDGNITGVRVVQHQETPGLGDDIELRRSDWVLSFNGKNISTPLEWKVKRDGGTFDQFTGATITPRAVVKSVHQTLIFYQNHKHEFN